MPASLFPFGQNQNPSDLIISPLPMRRASSVWLNPNYSCAVQPDEGPAGDGVGDNLVAARFDHAINSERTQ
jgi:hypothetical protein